MVTRWYIVENPDDHPFFWHEVYATKRDAIAAARRWCSCKSTVFRNGPGDYLVTSRENHYLGVQTGQRIIDRYGCPQR